MSPLIATLLALAFLGIALGRPLYAHLTEGSSDRADIRAAYEGLVGLAGPNAKVVGIERAGISMANRSLRRWYEIIVLQHNGQRLFKAVGVPVGPFSSHEVIEVG
jgi:hypothetical protein